MEWAISENIRHNGILRLQERSAGASRSWHNLGTEASYSGNKKLLLWLGFFFLSFKFDKMRAHFITGLFFVNLPGQTNSTSSVCCHVVSTQSKPWQHTCQTCIYLCKHCNAENNYNIHLFHMIKTDQALVLYWCCHFLFILWEEFGWRSSSVWTLDLIEWHFVGMIFSPDVL